jgi:hypothetical protein
LGRAAILALSMLGLAIGAAAGVACEVENPDHCANQDQAGNDYCAGLNSATPFCSPCHAKNHGCLPFEPVSCEDYVGPDEGGGMTGATMTGGAPMTGGMTGGPDPTN